MCEDVNKQLAQSLSANYSFISLVEPVQNWRSKLEYEM